MGGTPHYPPDPATDRRGIREALADAFGAARTRMRFSKIFANLLTLGQEDGTPRMELDASTVPKIRMVTANGVFELIGEVNELGWEGGRFKSEGLTGLGNEIPVRGSVSVGPREVLILATTTDVAPVGVTEFASMHVQVNDDRTGDAIIAANGVVSLQGDDHTYIHAPLDIGYNGTPGTPPGSAVRLYVQSSGGQLRLFYKNDAGAIFGPL
ncbi:MAG: hypothetical protein ACRDT8_00275 [Micromonosporaceae bacterium]